MIFNFENMWLIGTDEVGCNKKNVWRNVVFLKATLTTCEIPTIGSVYIEGK